MQQLRTLIRERRETLGWTQYKLAREMGLGSLDFVKMVEDGLSRFDYHRLPALANALGLPLEKLILMTLREKSGVQSPNLDALLGMFSELGASNQDGILHLIKATHRREVEEVTTPKKHATVA